MGEREATSRGVAGSGTQATAGVSPGKGPGKQTRVEAMASASATGAHMHPEDRGPQTALSYFVIHQRRFLDAIRARLGSTTIPPPHARLAWNEPGVLAKAFEGALIRVTDGGIDLALRLPELLHPVDPWRVIDEYRDLESGRPGERVDGQPALGATAWTPVAGLALAIELEGCLRRSVPRMGLRYVAQADDYAGDVTPELLVASHPFDRVVAWLLCDPLVTRSVGSRSHGRARAQEADTASPGAFRDGLRLVTFEWLGPRDPKLWNWVRASPSDAKPEEVAAAVFERMDGKSHSEYAYGLTSAPPFFRVPPEWARRFPAAAAYTPSEPARDDGGALELAESALGDEAAHLQAGKSAESLDLPALQRALAQSDAQLRLAADRLVAWNLTYLVGPAREWVRKHQDHLLAAPDATLKLWASILQGQSATLREALSDLLELTDIAASVQLAPNSPEAAPFREVIQMLGAAMGTSHLARTGAAQLAAARHRKAALPIVLLHRSTRETQAAARELADGGPAITGVFHGPDAGALARSNSRTLQAGAIELRAKSLAGAPIDPAELDALSVAAQEHSLRTRLLTLYARLCLLDTAADEATDGLTGHLGNLFNDDVWGLHRELLAVRPVLWTILQTMQADAVPPQLPSDPAAARRAFGDARRRAVANAQAAFAKLSEERQLATLFQRAIETITAAQRNTMYFTLLVQVGALIGVGVLGALAGALVGGVVRGAMLANAAADTAAFARTVSTARWAGATASIATDATVQAVAQRGLLGGDTRAHFAENVLANLLAIGALRPFHALCARMAALDDSAVGLWKVTSNGKVVLAQTTKLTLEMLIIAGASFVAARIVHGQPVPSDELAGAWAMQGASMAVGKFIHLKMRHLTERWSRSSEQGIHLLKRARIQQQLAEEVERTGDTEAALRLLDEHSRLLAAEHTLLYSPRSVAQLGLDETQLSVLRAGNDAAIADTSSLSFTVMKLGFHGLEPLASNGLAWSGTRAQIKAALDEAGDAAKNVHVTDGEQGTWTADIAGRKVTFVEASHAGGKPAGGGTTPVHDEDAAKPVANDESPALHPSEVRELLGRGAQPYELGVLAHVLAIDPPATRRLLATYPEEVLEQLRTQPFTTHKELESAAAKARTRIRMPIDGLYESTDTLPDGWKLDSGVPEYDRGGFLTIRTDVTGPNGAYGVFQSAYHPETQTVELRSAFLMSAKPDESPQKAQPLPSFVAKQDKLPEMIRGRGTPTVQYIMLHQLRRLGVPMGGSTAEPGVKMMRLDTIENVETIMHLHYMCEQLGGEASDLVVHTATMKHSETTALLAGYVRSDLPVVLGGHTERIGKLMQWQEEGGSSTREANDQLLKKYGYTRDTRMLIDFNVDFPVRPLR